MLTCAYRAMKARSALRWLKDNGTDLTDGLIRENSWIYCDLRLWSVYVPK